MLEPAPKQTRFVDVTSVAVDVDIRPAIVERSLDAVQVKITGAQRLEGTIDPGAVKVILRGPSDVVRRVDLEAVLVSVDGRLEDGRPPSSYRKRLVVSGLPSGVAAELRPDTVLLSTHRHHE